MPTDLDNPVTSDSEAISNQIDSEVTVIEERDPLTLEVDDKELLRRIKRVVKDSTSFYESKYHLKERQKSNEKYLFGRQIEDIKLKDYNTKFVDNVIWEAESYIKPIAVSRMPDVVVKPGQDTDEAKQIATDISKVVNSDIQSRDRRRVLGLAFRHLPVYFFGAIKYFWNPEKGKNGDYEFIVVHPENLVLDHTSPTNNPDDMRFVDEACSYSVKEVVMRFPDKEEDLYKELNKQGVFSPTGSNQKNDQGLSTIIQIHEIWFDWPEKVGSKQEYELVSGVAWYYGDTLLSKMKNPNWDWSGEKQTFTYKYTAPQTASDDKDSETKGSIENQLGLVQPTEDDLRNNIVNGTPNQNMQETTIFHNHFDNPRKPYIFMGYDQWGKTPLDETTRIEQNIYLQMNLDKRGKQNSEMMDRARGKHIFSVDSGLKKEDIEELDMADPNSDILVEGDVNAVHSFIPGEQPSPQMIQDKQGIKETILNKAGVHGAVRGENNSDSTATTTQIAREGDFTRADDLTEDTINYAAEEMANAILQMIKLRYTEDHLVRLLGEDGQTVFTKINRDLIQDGMEVNISASGVDKLKAEQKAFDMAKIKMIDPLSFFTDINSSDPRGRTERLMIFMTQPDLYITKYVMNPNDMLANTQNLAQSLNGGGQSQGSPQALQDIMQLQQGIIPAVPNMVDSNYLQTLEAFLSSPDFQNLITQRPDLKDKILQFAQQAVQVAQTTPQQPQGQQPPQTQQLPNQSAGQQPAGPISANPQPGDTTKINANPQTGGVLR